MGGSRKKKGSRRSPGERAERGPGAVRPDAFRAGLGSLERLLDDALQESGAPELDEDAPLVRAAEGALDLYAHLGRLLEEGSVSDALAGLRDRMAGDPDDFGYDRELEQALGPLLRFLYRRWWRVELVGAENVPASGPAVLVANHSGSLLAYDSAMLRVGLAEATDGGRSVRPLLDPEVCGVPVLGDVLARCGGVPATEENAATLLGRGDVVAVFPEGRAAFSKPFRSRYAIGAFTERGLVRAGIVAGAPILPVAIVGAGETHPTLGRLDWLAKRVGIPALPVTPTFPLLGVGGLLPLPSRWRIEIGAPLRVRAAAEGGASDARRVRRIADRARSRVQSLVDGAVERRGRAFL